VSLAGAVGEDEKHELLIADASRFIFNRQGALLWYWFALVYIA